MIDFDPWDQMLQQYVDLQGRVDYRAWQAAAAQLKDWLRDLSKQNLAEYTAEDQQLAFWINLYNALVIDQVLEIYPIRSIRPVVWGIPNWLSFLRFFQQPVYQMQEQVYTLNRIEHDILRPQFCEPRIHFALVCAAVGCPLLRNGAYYPDRVQTQLEEDAKRFINNPDKVRYDSSQLYCSKIFQWYQQDFIRNAGSIPQYIQKYLSPGVPLSATTRIRYLDYDWSLNQRISS